MGVGLVLVVGGEKNLRVTLSLRHSLSLSLSLSLTLTPPLPLSPFSSTHATPPPTAFDKREFRPCVLESTHDVSHNVKELTFVLNDPEAVTGVTLGAHLQITNGEYTRSYTPISPLRQRGRFTLVLKRYA